MKILWCYPNQHLRVTPPGGIAIITACLKRAGWNDVELFDSTWFPIDTSLKSSRTDRDKERSKRGMLPEYTWDGTGFRIENVFIFIFEEFIMSGSSIKVSSLIELLSSSSESKNDSK